MRSTSPRLGKLRAIRPHQVNLPLQTALRVCPRGIKQHQALKTRIAHTRHVKIVGVAPRSTPIVTMEIRRTDPKVRHVIGHRTPHVKGHTPIERLHHCLGNLAGSRGVLAAREPQRRQRMRVLHKLARRPHFFHVPVVHHTDAIAQAAGFIDVMAHVEHRGIHRIKDVEQVLLKRAFEI